MANENEDIKHRILSLFANIGVVLRSRLGRALKPLKAGVEGLTQRFHLERAMKFRKAIALGIGICLITGLMCLFFAGRESKSNGFRSALVDLLERAQPALRDEKWQIVSCSERKETNWRTRTIHVTGTLRITYSGTRYRLMKKRDASGVFPAVYHYETVSDSTFDIPFTATLYKGNSALSDMARTMKACPKFLRNRSGKGAFEDVADGVVILDAKVLKETLKHMEAYKDAESRLLQETGEALAHAQETRKSYHAFLREFSVLKIEEEPDADRRAKILQDEENWLRNLGSSKEALAEKRSRVSTYKTYPLQEILGADAFNRLDQAGSALTREEEEIGSLHRLLKEQYAKDERFHRDVVSGKVSLVTVPKGEAMRQNRTRRSTDASTARHHPLVKDGSMMQELLDNFGKQQPGMKVRDLPEQRESAPGIQLKNIKTL